MSTYTTNLNLFKYDLEEDGKQVFNFEIALNENWDKLDEELSQVEEDLSELNEQVETIENNYLHTTTHYYSSSAYSKYLKLNNGIIIQGGYVTGNSTTTLSISYSNTYYLLVGGLVPGTSSATYEHMNFSTKTVSTFYFYTYDSFKCYWISFGY